MKKNNCEKCQGRIKEIPSILEKIKSIKWTKAYSLLVELEFICPGCGTSTVFLKEGEEKVQGYELIGKVRIRQLTSTCEKIFEN